MKKIILIFMLFSILSCKKTTTTNSLLTTNLKNSYLIINEGNYNWNNGSISIYYADSNKIENQVYQQINGQKLGDIPQSACLSKDYIYLVINNSGKIIRSKRNSLQKVDELLGFVSPRYMILDNNRAYVSDLYAGKISILNLNNFTIEKEISTPKSTENMLLLGTKLYVLNWSFGDKLLIINTLKDKISDSIKLTLEPNSLVLDKKNNLWILCGGGFTSTEYPAMYKIDTQKDSILAKFQFSSKADSPFQLTINATKDTLFFLNTAIYKMGIRTQELPTQFFISNQNRNLYTLMIDKENRIWTSDAKDFVKNSNVYIYQSNGDLISTFKSGVNTSRIYEL